MLETVLYSCSINNNLPRGYIIFINGCKPTLVLKRFKLKLSPMESVPLASSCGPFTSQGELVEDSSIQRSVVVECMEWHPENKIIAIGWRSGEITTYNDDDHEFFEQSSIHRASISFLKWNKGRLISGDMVSCVGQTNVSRLIVFSRRGEPGMDVI